MTQSNQHVAWTAHRRRRRGISTLWILIALPALLVMLCFLINVANLWLARVELENALESSALVAVIEWGGAGGSTEIPRDVAVAYANANKIRTQKLQIDPNYDPSQLPNENLTCTLQRMPPGGNLIFGAIVNDSPLTFDATAVAGCSTANVLVEICKGPESPGGGGASASTVPDSLGIFYRDGAAGVSITEVKIRIPEVDVNNLVQHPYWFGSFASTGRKPVVSLTATSDSKNLNNTVVATAVISTMPLVTEPTLDVRGMDPSPTTGDTGNPQNSNWNCPNPNGSGICFRFEDPIAGFADRFRTLVIQFDPGEFEPPSDPGDSTTWEFIRFGASLNRLGPSAFPGQGPNNNSGDMFGIAGVETEILFSDGATCRRTFVDTGGMDGRSEAVCGGGSGNDFAVRAQAEVQVPIICGRFFLLANDSYCVKAKATAVFDCETGKARLVRIKNENFICP